MASTDLRTVQKDCVKHWSVDTKGVNYSQINELVNQVAEKVLTYSQSIGEGEDAFRDRLSDAIDVIRSTKYILSPPLRDRTGANSKLDDAKWETKQKQSEHRVWYRRDLGRAFQEGWDFDQNEGFDRDELGGEIAKYLERPWMENRTLEWIFLDSLIFEETREFGDVIKRSLPGRRNLIGLNWAYLEAGGNLDKMQLLQLRNTLIAKCLKLAFYVGMPVVATWWAWTHGHEQQALFGGLAYAAILVLVIAFRTLRRLLQIGQPIEKTPQQRSAELYTQMCNVYELLKGPVINPSVLRESIMQARISGAVWNSPVYALIDRIVARDPAVWTISERYLYGAR
jgi:hypothetical protein